MYNRIYHNLNFITDFFEGWSWFKFNNLGLSLGTNLKFYTCLSKGLKVKVRKFWSLIATFVEVTGEKLVGVGGIFTPPPPLSWVWLKYYSQKLRRKELNLLDIITSDLLYPYQEERLAKRDRRSVSLSAINFNVFALQS